ncbi:glycosyltransferase family 4 protein [Geodermatophilaceae bacterium NBWT11]|nr:glycosyltransferase family 4 protein [Geodermatophilaceae bacterium NBWT11]
MGTDQFAGLERYVVEVASEQSRRGHHVSVVGGDPASMQRLLTPAVEWHPGATPRDALRALVRQGRRDVVHSHITKADFVALAAAPVNRGRRFSTRHLTAPRGHGPRAQRLAPLVRRALHREIAVSRFVSDEVRPASDVVLLNGVREQPDTSPDRQHVVLMAHRLAPEKDTETGIRAWALSGLADRGWTLVIAGHGAERDPLEQLARELGVADSTDFVGWLPDPTDAFRTSGVLLAPALAEPCGLSILEAMSFGLPVVASASGGNPETVGTAAGATLFPAGDANAAADHLWALADDPTRRATYGRELQELQRAEFSLGVHVDRLTEVYQRGEWGGPR